MSEDRVRQHDEVEPTAPTWRFWLLTVLGFPVAGIAVLFGIVVLFALSAVRAPVGLAALGLLALEGWLLTHERTVRHMAQRRRAVWVVIGCLTTAAIGALGGTVLFFALLFEQCSGGC